MFLKTYIFFKEEQFHILDRARISMYIHHMTYWVVSPATGTGDQSAGVSLHHKVGEVHGIMLTPTLIKHNPEDDAGMVPQLPHPHLRFALEYVLGCLVCLLHVDGVSDTREVLPDQHAKLVCPVIPSGK